MAGLVHMKVAARMKMMQQNLSGGVANETG
jgi:hypothetical protein